MLLVNAFNPIQKSYNSQNPNKTGFRQLRFQSKCDSVSFTSNLSSAETVGKQTEALVKRFLKAYPCLGKGAAEFVNRWDVFLFSKGAMFQLQDLPSTPLVVDYKDTIGAYRNMTMAYLVDKKIYKPIVNLPSVAPSRNLAKIALLNLITKDKTALANSSLKDVEFPADMLETSSTIQQAIYDFYSQWRDLPYVDMNAKIAAYKTAIDKLMGEPAYN